MTRRNESHPLANGLSAIFENPGFQGPDFENPDFDPDVPGPRARKIRILKSGFSKVRTPKIRVVENLQVAICKGVMFVPPNEDVQGQGP